MILKISPPSSSVAGRKGVALVSSMLLAAGLASAAVTPLDYFRMGENDTEPLPGQKVYSTHGLKGGSLKVQGGNAIYVSAAGAGSVDRVGSSVALGLSGIQYLSGNGFLVRDNFGFECWVKPLAAGNRVVMFNGSSHLGGCSIMQVGTTVQARIGEIHFGSGPLPRGEWTHVAFVRRSGVATLYVNGVAHGTSSHQPPDVESRFYVGGREGGSEGGFDGSIDEVRIFRVEADAFFPDDLLLQSPRVSLSQDEKEIVTGGHANFEVQPVGGHSDITLTLSNSGLTNLSPVTASITGVDAGSFSLVSAPPVSLQPGGTRTFTVRFEPSSTGSKTARLNIFSNDSAVNPFELKLKGRTPGQEITLEMPDGKLLEMGTVTVFSGSQQLKNVPATLMDVSSLSVGPGYALALRRDGNVVGWGSSSIIPSFIPQGVADAVAVAAGSSHSLVLTKNGTVKGFGSQTNAARVPAGLNNVVAIAAGSAHSLALRKNGTVVGWGGSFTWGAADVPAGLTDVIAIAAGAYHSLALKSNGTVVAWGSLSWGATSVPSLGNVIAIAAGENFSMALQEDGKVVRWGIPPNPTFPTGVTHVSAGGSSYLATASDGSVTFYGISSDFTTGPGYRNAAAGDDAVMAVREADISFGNQMSPYASSPKQLTIRNSGSEPVTLTDLTFRGSDSADFTLSSSSLPITLGPSATTEISIQFIPLKLGSCIAALDITSNAANAELLSVNLSGTGVLATPVLKLYEGNDTTGLELINKWGEQNFPETAVGGQVVKTFTIKNDGYLDLARIQPWISGADPADFSFTPLSTSVLTPGQSATFSVSFSPRSPGLRTGVLRIANHASGANHFEVNLTGHGSGADIQVLSPDGIAIQSGVITTPLGSDSGDMTIPAGLVGVKQISGGAHFHTALLNGGKVTAWGDHSDGRLSPPLGLSSVVSIAALSDTSFAVKSDGTVVSWGRNIDGVADVPSGLSGVKKIAAGGSYVMALKTDGTVVTWGKIDSAVARPSGLTQVVDVSTDGGNAFALKQDGSVLRWGRSSPTLGNALPAQPGVIKLVACYTYLAGLKDDGSMVYWYDPNDMVETVPYPGTDRIVDVSMANGRILGNLADGSLEFFDIQQRYQLFPAEDSAYTSARYNAGSIMAVSIPRVHLGTTSISPAAPIREMVIRNTGSSSLSIQSVELISGDVGSFSVDTSLTNLSLGADQETTFAVRFAPSKIGLSTALLRVRSSDLDQGEFDIQLAGEADVHAPALVMEESDGTPLVGGRVMELGMIQESPNFTPMPPGLKDVVAVSSGEKLTVALKKDGKVITWGNRTGHVPFTLDKVVSISAGHSFALALRQDGSMVRWGTFNPEYLGPMPTGLENITRIAAGKDHGIAVNVNALMASWAPAGETYQIPPMGVGMAVQLAAGDKYSTALLPDGSVVSWGGAGVRSPTWLSNVSAIDVGYGTDYGIALKSDGTVAMWDRMGDSIDEVPSNLSGVQAVAAGNRTGLALLNDGSVVGWGENINGNLNIPGNLRNVRAISAGYSHTTFVLDAYSDFLSRAVPSAPIRKTYVIRNQGYLPLEITGVNLFSGDIADFSVDTTDMLTSIVPGASTRFSVDFRPAAGVLSSALLRVTSNDPDDAVFEIRLTGEGIVPGSPLELWKLIHFATISNTGRAANIADANGNGIANLVEYALGGDPVGGGTGTSILPRFSFSETGSFLYQFKRDPSLTDIILTVQAGGDLDADWVDIARSTGGADFESLVEGVTVGETPSGELRQVVIEDAVPTNGNARPPRFLRLQVTVP